MKLSQKLLSLALAGAMTLSLAAPALAAEEAPNVPWYAEAQAYVTEKGIMTGTDKGFEPEGVVTRATVFQTLWNLEGAPEVAAPAEHLLQMSEGMAGILGYWWESSARWAYSVGLTTGDEYGAFNGDRSITRAEIATILTRYAKDKGVEVEETHQITQAPDFPEIPAWAQEGMTFCYDAGLMTGDQEGRMNPAATATRAELAILLMRLAGQTPAFTEEVAVIDVAEQDGIPAHKMVAVVTLPKTAEGVKVPAVVMLHGTGSTKDEAGNGYAMAAPMMAKAGIASIRFDFMGNGDSEASYTDYCYTSANIDAKAAADYVAGLDGVDSDKIAVMGWSQGGTNTLLAAAAYPETFKAVITWAGALSLDESTGLFGDKTFDEAYAIAKADGSYEMTFDWRDSLQVGERWFKEVAETDVLAETAKIEAPVLAINGDQDTTVLPENAAKIAAAAKNGRELLIAGADHTYNVFTEIETGYAALNKTVNAGIGFLQETLNGRITGTINAVSKYGNVGTDIPVDYFEGAGYAVGDILIITIDDAIVDAPYGTGYSNVDTGKVIILADSSTNTVAAAINMGNFSSTYNAPVGTPIQFQMGEKEGYLEEYTIRNIDALRTNVREDYASDEAFANFRPVVMGDIAEGVLYRSSSPVNPELGRNTYVDAFAKDAGIKTIIDLADSEEEYEAYEGVTETYAYTTNTVKLDMGVDFAAEDFAEKLKTGLEYMIANEGPYLIHCNEGKDRAGFVAMLLEALMGGELDEIVDDYMLSYENYYHVEHDSDRWNRIAQSNVIANLLKLTGAEDEAALGEADLAAAAETYLTGTVGLTAEQVNVLRDALAGK